MTHHSETSQDRFDAWFGEVPSAAAGAAVVGELITTSPERRGLDRDVSPGVDDTDLTLRLSDKDLYRRHEPVISWILCCPMLDGDLRMIPVMSTGSPVFNLLERGLGRIPSKNPGLQGLGRFELVLVMLLRRLGWIAFFDPLTGKVREIKRPVWLDHNAPGR